MWGSATEKGDIFPFAKAITQMNSSDGGLPLKRRRLSTVKGRKPERTAGSTRGSRFRLRGTSKLRK